MNKRNKSVIVLIYCLFMISLFIVNVNGNVNNLNPKTSALGDIEYNFQENIFYNETNPNYDFGYNTRNQTVYTEIYNGTYSFTYDVDGSNPTDWIIATETDVIEIVGNYENHDKVLHIDGIGWNELYQQFTSQESGSVEYWFRTDDSSMAHYLTFKDTATTRIYFYVQTGNFNYNDGSPHTIVACSNNMWYHIRFDFECGTGSYKGLSADTYYIYINGKQYGAYGFSSVSTTINQNSIATTGNVESHYDSYGYLWDTGYNLNDNIIPYHYDNETLEIDKWDFFNNVDGSNTVNGQQDIPYWNELLTIGYITKNVPQFIDETVVYFPIGDVDHEGLEKSIDISTSNVKEINFNVCWGTRLGSVKLHKFFDIDSYDDTLICRLKIDDSVSQGDLKLYYYDGSSYIELEDVNNVFTTYFINIIIIDNIVVLNLNYTTTQPTESNGNSTYSFPTIVNNKEGLGDIKIEVYADSFYPANGGLMIDSIGVYVDGLSICNDFANYYYYINKDFSNKVCNFLELNATGYFGLSMSSFEMSPQTFIYFNYQNVAEIDFMNVYDESEKNVENSYLTITTNVSYDLYNVLIEGVKLNEGTNNYYPSYETSGIDIETSYFYVVNNELRYVLRADDSNLEYMLITFDINNIVTYNKTFTYTSQRNSVLPSELRLAYLDETTTIINIVYGYRTEKMSLPINKELDYYQILVTDNDLYNNKNGTGYFSSFILRGSGTYEMDITTINLLEALTPLLFFIIFPALLIAYFLRQSPKDDLSKKILIPLLMVFSLIAFGFGSIPLWSLFLLILAFGSLFLITNDEGDD